MADNLHLLNTSIRPCTKITRFFPPGRFHPPPPPAAALNIYIQKSERGRSHKRELGVLNSLPVLFANQDFWSHQVFLSAWPKMHLMRAINVPGWNATEMCPLLHAARSYCKSFKNAVAHTLFWSRRTPPRHKELHTNLGALDLQLHVVLARRFPILPLLPTVAVSAVAHFLPAVEQHAAALGSATKRMERENKQMATPPQYFALKYHTAYNFFYSYSLFLMCSHIFSLSRKKNNFYNDKTLEIFHFW